MATTVGMGAKKKASTKEDSKLKAKIAELEKKVATTEATNEELVKENEGLKAKIAELEKTSK